MIVDLRTISHGPSRFAFTLEPDWWQGDQSDGQILGFDGPLDVKISLTRAGRKYVVDGCLSGHLVLRCGRCLEPYSYHINPDFRLFISVSCSDTGESELELFEEDLSVEFSAGEEIDLDDIVREQIYLSLPIKSLCVEDCLGLCPICGVNLNKGKCQCLQNSGHPGFLKLKNLILEGKKD